MITSKLLAAVGSEEPSSFNEVLRGLGDDGPPTSMSWREFLELVDVLERTDLIEVERSKGRIDTMILTQLGKERVKEIQGRE